MIVARVYQDPCEISIRASGMRSDVRMEVKSDRSSRRRVCVKYIIMYNINSTYQIGIIYKDDDKFIIARLCVTRDPCATKVVRKSVEI